MKIKDVMTPGAETIGPDAKLTDVARKMKELDVGVLPVVDDSRVLGVVTDRDLVVRGLAEDGAGRNPVREVMSGEAKTCAEQDDLTQAAKLMEQHQIRRLVVTDEQGSVSGMLSLGDLADKAKDPAVVEIFKAVSQPAEPRR